MRAFALLGALVASILASSCAVGTPTSAPNRLLPHGYHAQAFARKDAPVNASASANDTTNAKTVKHPDCGWSTHCSGEHWKEDKEYEKGLERLTRTRTTSTGSEVVHT